MRWPTATGYARAAPPVPARRGACRRLRPPLMDLMFRHGGSTSFKTASRLAEVWLRPAGGRQGSDARAGVVSDRRPAPAFLGLDLARGCPLEQIPARSRIMSSLGARHIKAPAPPRWRIFVDPPAHERRSARRLLRAVCPTPNKKRLSLAVARGSSAGWSTCAASCGSGKRRSSAQPFGRATHPGRSASLASSCPGAISRPVALAPTTTIYPPKPRASTTTPRRA